MAQRAVREGYGKQLLRDWLPKVSDDQVVFNVRNTLLIARPPGFSSASAAAAAGGSATDRPGTPVLGRSNSAPYEEVDGDEGELTVDFDAAEAANPWLLEVPLVVKPDQLIKRRGKAGLIAVNKTWEEVKAWVAERAGKETQVEHASGILTHFLVEEFVPHRAEDEYYVCIQSLREGEEILFTHEGGVDVGDVDSKALRLLVPPAATALAGEVQSALLAAVPEARRPALSAFICALLAAYRQLHFCYLEINPLVFGDGEKPTPLDLAAKIDEAAAFVCLEQWQEPDFPTPFGRAPAPEEAYIRELDSKTGASLKLTLLNPQGSVWTMVAGGGASVVYADTITDLGAGKELANYGEYSGAPSEDMTFEYAKTVLRIMSRCHRRNKVLIVGGGIANFTDVAKTFKGIIRALRDFRRTLREQGTRVYVRRGGPNFAEGLQLMRNLSREIRVPIYVYGPETHMTAIVAMALGQDTTDLRMRHAPGCEPLPPVEEEADQGHLQELGSPNSASRPAAFSDDAAAPAAAAAGGAAGAEEEDAEEAERRAAAAAAKAARAERPDWQLFTPHTRSIVFGMQRRAVQGMLDFDYMCRRKHPSVAAIVFPFSGNHRLVFYWGTKEIFIPVYSSLQGAIEAHDDVDVMVNFSNFRRVRETTLSCLEFSEQIRTIAIIAEGVPEQQARELLAKANEKGVCIIGPATVGGIKPGCFRIGNTGGMIDNVVASKLYRPGSVSYVSKSGGMSNEINNLLARVTDGVCEGVAIGGDRYPGTRFLDHLLRYQADPNCKMMVLLGEVGGVDEYAVVEAIRDGRITKPLVAWCIGTCAKIFPFEVQFGHAGALANSQRQTADAKNSALKEVGAVVPDNFNDLVAKVRDTYAGLVRSGVVERVPDVTPPKIPMDYDWARSTGLIRKPPAFVSTISDERGKELCYAGMPISQVFKQDVGVGGVLALLWFKRQLPPYATKFIEMVLMVTADHGPAVAGAHNAIVTARAGKDLISSLCSGLLTIGPRFGGALDKAANDFAQAFDSGLAPRRFVERMRAARKFIMGIGHKVKSIHNPDMRVTIIKEFALEHFPETPVLDYALEVEAVTTQKRDNLILNVDGCIAACFVDLLRGCGAFTKEEADEVVESGALNGLFVLGRSIGIMGHFLDQKRLNQGLYRHPTDDISYMMPE